METKLTRRPWRSHQPKLRRRHKFGRHLQKCFWKAKVLLESKNTSGKGKYFWQGKILLARENTSGKENYFWQAKMLLARKNTSSKGFRSRRKVGCQMWNHLGLVNFLELGSTQVEGLLWCLFLYGCLVVVIYMFQISWWLQSCFNLWQQVWWEGAGWARQSLTHQLRCRRTP